MWNNLNEHFDFANILALADLHERGIVDLSEDDVKLLRSKLNRRAHEFLASYDRDLQRERAKGSGL